MKVSRQDERGFALIAVLLLLMMMSALAAALTTNGTTETLIARNHLFEAQAQEAAEAGLNHAVEVTTQYLFDYKSHGYMTVEEALDDVLTLAAAGSLNGLELETETNLVAGTDIGYSVNILDDDGATTGDDVENVDLLDDLNKALLITSTGTGSDGTKVMLEAIITPVELPAIVTGGDLTINGNVTISSTGDNDDASVHSNGNLTLTGNSADIEGNATASGTETCSPAGCPQVDGDTGGGATKLPIPEVHASDYLVDADYVLESTGQMTCHGAGGCDVDGNTTIDFANGVTICDASTGNHKQCQDDYGWEFSGGTQWDFNRDPAYNIGTYYIEGSPTTRTDISAHTTTQMTVISETSLRVRSGGPDLTADTSELLFVTDGDLEIEGSPDVGEISGQGQILVHEQLSISGSPVIQGQVIVEDGATLSSYVTANSISGNATISYDGTLGTAFYGVTTWRDVRGN
jgi:hypothetical protein